MTDIIKDLKAGCDPLLDEDSDIRKCNAYLMALCQDAALEIESLRQRLHEVSLSWQEGQAREAKLRELWSHAIEWVDCDCGCQMKKPKDRPSLQTIVGLQMEALALPTDDTALKEAIKQAKKEALLEAANLLFESTDEPPINGNQLAQMRVSMIAEKLRYLAEEVK